MNNVVFALTCSNSYCQFRTTALYKPTKLNCPLCNSPLSVQDRLLKNNALVNADNKKYHKFALSIVLDNIRSALNVGSIMRTADGCGVQKLFFCGATSTPDHPKVAKTGLGAEWSIPWEYHPNSVQCIMNLLSDTRKILLLEWTDKAEDLFLLKADKLQDKEIVLVVGNELTGIDPAVLELIDQHIYIPMIGYKKSLNVAVALE